MQKVKAKKSELLRKLKENLESHVKTYNLTVKNYRIQAKKDLEKFYVDASNTLNENEPKTVYFQCPTLPVSYVKEYETAIQLLNFSVDKTVELTMSEFQQYVMDEWKWKANFTQLSGMYNNK